MATKNLLQREDTWAILIGFILLLTGLTIYFANPPSALQQTIKTTNTVMERESAKFPFKSIEWYAAFDEQQSVKGSGTPIGKFLKKLTGKPSGWTSSPMEALFLTEAQAASKKTANSVKFQAAQQQVSGALSRLMLVIEKYPDLKANQNFLALQTQLEGTENRITNERRMFNEAVQSYNTYILKLPQNLIASISGFAKKPYFETDKANEEAPKISF